jgi:bifunctional DNase/RNase
MALTLFLILNEVDGEKKVAIVIGSTSAINSNNARKKNKTSMLTHDLFKILRSVLTS